MTEMNAKKLGWVLLLILFFFMVLFHPAFPQEKRDSGVSLDTSLKTEVIVKVGQLLVDNYIFSETAAKMQEHLDRRQEEGEYDKINDVYDFARILTQDLRSVSKDKHIRVTFSPEQVQRIRARNSLSEEEREKERKERLERERQSNYGFQRLEILEGNIGYLDLRYFSGESQAGDTIAAAMNLLANADAVIIDLRQNGGGSPLTIQVISSYFLEDYTHLNNFEWRGSDSIQQFWTLPYVPGKKMYDTDLYILTSRRTFSGAEEFTYNMKNLKRATVVGETTGGGAHPGGSRIVNDYFLVWVPSGRAINPISKTNWEGTGIEPDISVSQDQALDKAHFTSLEKLEENTSDEKQKQRFNWVLDMLRAKLGPAKVQEEILRKYVGQYTRGDVIFKDGQLFIKAGPQEFKMIPLSETYFVVEEGPDVRIEFVLGEKENEFDIISHLRDGRQDLIKRIKAKR